jgi:hypothetical protein
MFRALRYCLAFFSDSPWLHEWGMLPSPSDRARLVFYSVLSAIAFGLYAFALRNNFHP